VTTGHHSGPQTSLGCLVHYVNEIEENLKFHETTLMYFLTDTFLI